MMIPTQPKLLTMLMHLPLPSPTIQPMTPMTPTHLSPAMNENTTDTPSLCLQQLSLPVLTPLYLPDFQRHLMKLDNLQKNIQQLYAAMNQLIVALSAVVLLLPLLQETHNTSSNFKLPPKPDYPNAIAYLDDPPAPLDPSTKPINNQHSATFSNIPQHQAPSGATSPATLPTMTSPNTPMVLCPAPAHLLNI